MTPEEGGVADTVRWGTSVCGLDMSRLSTVNSSGAGDKELDCASGGIRSDDDNGAAGWSGEEELGGLPCDGLRKQVMLLITGESEE
jgi:hypothetical protein